jgi:hypothetical protein
METLQIIFATGMLSTLAMTMFSYGLSYISGNKFEEPQLINILFSRSSIFSDSIAREHVLGWAIHFIIGILFVICFKVLLQFDVLHINLLVGILFGAISGIFGAIVWAIALALHPNPPKMNRTGYLLQLIPAHIIFGVVMVILFQ